MHEMYGDWLVEPYHLEKGEDENQDVKGSRSLHKFGSIYSYKLILQNTSQSTLFIGDGAERKEQE